MQCTNINMFEACGALPIQCRRFSRYVLKFLNRLNFYPSMLSENCDWINQPFHNAPKTDSLKGYFDL